MRIRKTMMIIPAFIAVILAGCSSDVITEQASSATASINNEQSPVKNNQDNSETNESGDNGEFYLESEKIKKRYIGFLKGKELLYLDVLDSYEV
ncbi:MAG: hypothetical protein K6A23_09960, partial [Butyrivibrio sp.]|nr:hypothetical protein [Butyrivibrio sp.]